MGLRIYKVGCPWPISKQDLQDFAKGLDLIIVVEEKRSLIEVQVREELYGTANQPVCIGKKDEQGNWLFPVKGALDPNEVAICIGERLLKVAPNEQIAGHVARLKEAQRVLAETQDVAVRTPYFCSGCPHNSSTVVPEGSRAYAGIGCHFMAQWMDRSTLGYTHMGGEGANWIGEAPFSKRAARVPESRRRHLQPFRLHGDPRRDRVGRQHHLQDPVQRRRRHDRRSDARRWPHRAADRGAGGGRRRQARRRRQRRAEEISAGHRMAARASRFHHRDDLQAVQKVLSEIPGCTVLIYDQTCAAEKRRRRKRGTFPDPDKRVIINELVCEGCGDCGVQSNCVSVQPLETEFGRKRTDRPVVLQQGLFLRQRLLPVVRHRAWRQAEEGRRRQSRCADAGHCPSPTLPRIGQTYNIIVTGVGGTGVVTIGGILGMAAHLEGKGVGIIDMAGLAQKGGAVYSHMRIAERPEDIHAIRVAAGGADLVLGGDIVVAGNKKVLARCSPARPRWSSTLAEFLPGDFTRNADFSLPTERLKRAISTAAGAEQCAFHRRQRGSRARCSARTLAANVFLVGYAYQLGAMPLSGEAIEQAIELNGEAVKVNLAAFRWGRRAARRSGRASRRWRSRAGATRTSRLSQSFDEMVERRVEFLTAYQNAAYAARYRALVEKAKAAEAARAPGQCGLRRGGGALSVQADGLQGRVRGGAALHRRQLPEAGGERRSTARTCASSSISRRRCWREARPDHRRAAQDDLRPVDDDARSGCWRSSSSCAARVRSVRLFAGAKDRAQADRRLRGDA